MIAYLLRVLCAVVGVVSPSVLATLRRSDPLPRLWLARRERAVALRFLGDRPTLAERIDAETERYAAHCVRVARSMPGVASARVVGPKEIEIVREGTNQTLAINVEISDGSEAKR